MKFKIVFIIVIAIFLSGCTNLQNSYNNQKINNNINNQENKENKQEESLSLSKNFLEKYNILYREKFLGDNIYLNDKKILENSYNIWPYSYDGKFYTAKDSTQKDIQCGDIILKKQEDQYNGLNFWCLNYKNNYYISTSAKPFYIDNDYIIYEQCEDYEYLDYIKKNGCTKVGLYINNQKIDYQYSNINESTKEKFLNTGFRHVNYDENNKQIMYLNYGTLDKNEEGWYLYDVASNKTTKIFDYSSISKAISCNGKIAYTIQDFKEHNFDDNFYNLYYKNNIYKGVNEYSVMFIDGKLYYAKSNLYKVIDNYSALFEIVLIKNDKMISKFYKTFHKSFGDNYLEIISIKKQPYCLPKDDVCIIDDNNFLTMSNEYKEIDGINLSKIVYNINNKQIDIKSSDYPYYLYPVSESDVVKYVIFGDASGNKNYIKDIESGKEEFLYDGDAPIIIYKK